MAADLILTNGRIWAGLASGPDAEGLAVAGDRIAAAGSAATVGGLRGPDTRVIDLDGRLVVPGFHDCHVHFAGGCLQLQRVSLKDAPDEAEFGRRLREFDARLPEGAWMVGGRWDHDLTFGGTLPTAAIIDRYVPARPTFLRRYDGHIAVANSVAMRLAGVTRGTPDPHGGQILRDCATGEPTGGLQDAAMDLVWRHIPDPDAEDIAAAMPAGLELAARMGITSVHDMLGDGEACLAAYRRLRERGELTVRVNLYWPIWQWEAARDLRAELPLDDDSLRLCGVKAFVDGSLGAGTAWFFTPYTHQPDNSGFPVVDMDGLGETMRAADAEGLQLAVHAIGDRAVAELLDAWERVVDTNGPRDRRLRMEHAQHIRPQDVRRFAELGAIASMQPYHATDDARWMADRIGLDRCRDAYVLRSLADTGVPLAFGSDWPVAPLDVIAGIDSAVLRRPAGGSRPGGWHPEQRLTVAEALRAYTRTAAYAAFIEGRLGTLEPGKLADLAVLSHEIMDPARLDLLGNTEVWLTMVGGRIVHGAEVGK